MRRIKTSKVTDSIAKVVARAPNEAISAKEADKTSEVVDRTSNEASPTKVADRAIIGP
ncbi:hypothetical protein MKY88_08645 [Lysinibacillus sp. FSL R7-0073]|uniref:hypothetical protein n=1 Tax=Lysinibacillus sp. FSL R7-0073 TaxID=2921669 RepID=UPI0030F6D1F2